MKNTNKDLKQEILKMISDMENNTFLFPHSYSETIDMIDLEYSYRTYNNGARGESRYHNVEIYVEGSKILEINFSGNTISYKHDIDKKPLKLKEIHSYILDIYNEKHSFKNHNEGRRNIRKKIKEKRLIIKTAKQEIEYLNKQLLDSKGL